MPRGACLIPLVMATSDGSVPAPTTCTTTDSKAVPSCLDSSSFLVSILDRMKSPIPAEITRKRNLKTNPSPAGKCQYEGTVASDPKSIEPRKRIRELPNKMLKVSAGTLFCEERHEELGLRKSTIHNVRLHKHAHSKKKWKMKEAREQDIAIALMKYNEKEHLEYVQSITGILLKHNRTLFGALGNSITGKN